jgi:MFS family permease
MELLLEQEVALGFWRNPAAWLRRQKLSSEYWTFFAAAFFFDAGFGVYFFLFNLYLLDYRFNERAIGLIGGAFTLGSVLATLPAGVLARKIPIRPLLVACFVASSALNGCRAVWMWEPAQICLAFLAGAAMCMWGICFLPAVARLTTAENRTSAFSLIFTVSIGTAILGGLISGYLPQWLQNAGFFLQAAEVKRGILLASCAIALAGLFAILRLRIPATSTDICCDGIVTRPESASASLPFRRWLHRFGVTPFLVRFLPVMALWSAVLAAFNPFANLYLSRDLHMPLARIGVIFSTTQLVQLCLGLVTPVVFRIVGLARGILLTQSIAAVTLACMALVKHETLAVALYIGFSAAQWICSPGLYNLLMNKTPDKDRSTASAATLFCNALAGAGATAGTGILFTRFGYPHVLLGIAAVAFATAMLFGIVVVRDPLNAAEPL